SHNSLVISSHSQQYIVIVNTMFFSFFFFFQAEDGIRDLIVTGVQTCALPISHSEITAGDAAVPRLELLEWANRYGVVAGITTRRSEERRVGKECRSRWWPAH